jgi:hypothetical protein
VKTIIAGSREINRFTVVEAAIAGSGFDISEVVSGTARGVDTLGEMWAREHGVPVRRFPAAWDKHGKSAGYVRNLEMAQYADALIAVWDGKSRGTGHTIDIANRLGLKVHVYRCDKPE